jgi:hypothetical protein
MILKDYIGFSSLSFLLLQLEIGSEFNLPSTKAEESEPFVMNLCYLLQ